MSLAPFVSSSMDNVRRMIKLAGVGAGDVAYDLGSGDGRIMIAAVRDFKAKRAIGIESRDDLANKARIEIRRQNLESRVEVIHGDALKVNVSEADVVTLYLTSKGNEMLRSKLEEELKPGARVVSHDYKIIGWKPIKVDGPLYRKLQFRKIYLYQR